MKHFVSSLILLLLTAQVPAQQTGLLPGQLPRIGHLGGTIFRCLFDPSMDAEDGNGWPDRWQRKHGIDQGIPFPDYLEILMVASPNPFGHHVLRMNMQGGGAAAFTPKIPVRPGTSYTVSVYVDAENLVFDDVSLLLSFHDGESVQPLRSIQSDKVRNTNGWRELRVGPIVADQPNVQSLSVGLLVVPEGRQDFGARVDFTNLEIRESPTVSMVASAPHHLFPDPKRIDVACHLSGIDPVQQTVDFVLEDPFGRVIAKKEIEMMIGNKPASRLVVTEDDRETVFRATAAWNDLPILSPGFYRVRVATPEHFSKSLKLPEGVYFRDPLLDTESLNLVVAAPTSWRPDGEFGWNLQDWNPQEIDGRLELLRQSGLSRLKIPAWLPQNASPEQRRALNVLCDRLSLEHVGLVGLLYPIPKEVRERIKFGPVNAASLFSLPTEVWSDSIQQTLQELSLLIKDWQWTADDDLTLSDLPGFEHRYDDLRQAFDRNDFGFGVGFAWNWDHPLPQRFGTVPSRVAGFVALTSEQPLTPDDLKQYLQSLSAGPIRRFVSLTPLSSRDYQLQDRIVDLLRRMVVAKVAGADALFLSKPIDDRTGVLRTNLTPTELYLPWRTTSTLLSGRPYLGSVVFPNRSRNFSFDLGGGRAVTVLWNDLASEDKPINETIYLGEEVEIVDVWGKRFKPELRGRDQVISVGPVPIFVMGCDSTLVRQRLGFHLHTKEIPSLPNVKNTIPFSMTNDTNYALSAQISVVGPRPNDWKIGPLAEPLTLEPGRSGSSSFDLTLNPSANTGLQPIRIDVKTKSIAPMEFSVYDDIQIGEKDLRMEFSVRTNRNGDLEVTQAFINDGDRAYTYICRLYVSTQPYQTTNVTRQGFGRIEHVYTIPKGGALRQAGVTEINVQARPVDGGQPMNYTIPLP